MKQENQIVFLVILCIVLSMTTVYLYINPKQSEDTKEILKERKELKLKINALKKENETLKQRTPEIVYERDTIYITLKSQRNETDKINDNVKLYPDRKLDSILSNYRFIKRTKSRDSISNTEL